MDSAQVGICLLEHSGAGKPACPFLPPQRWDWDGPGLMGFAEWYQLRPGLDYMNVACRLDGPDKCRVDLGTEFMVMGHVTRGWAKWTSLEQAVEKVEAGQWFMMPRREFSIDRTHSDGVEMGLCLCSREMANQLSELNPKSSLHEQLVRFTESGGALDFESGPMDATTFALAREMVSSESKGLKRRLTIESNALTWIAETLSQSEAGDDPAGAGLNAGDREAVERLCERMRQDPGYEYSLSELCALSGLNEHKLKTAFKRIHGKTTFGYLRELRMEQAARLLKEDRLSVIQVANEVGYSNASHFARGFKEQHGLLPKAYQCLHRRTF